MKFLSTILLLLLVLLAACSKVPSELACTTVEDCRPAQCCHPTSSVNSEYAPDCSGILCTAVCEPKTLDCDQGKIECVEGQCIATIG